MGAVLVFGVSAARTYAVERHHFVFVAHIHAVEGPSPSQVKGGALVAVRRRRNTPRPENLLQWRL